MFSTRKSSDRGHATHGWLEAYHSFSFADYHDPEHMGFSVLRVINEDRIVAGAGFPFHSHQDMEIITYVVEGELEHKDSLGNSAVIRPGDVQRMSAGTGVKHSEFNPSKTSRTHLLQIWIFPDKQRYSPSYEQKNFDQQLARGQLVLVASNKGENNSVSLNQDIKLHALKSPTQGETILNANENRSYWLQVVKGVVKMNDLTIGTGDATQARLETRLHLSWHSGSEFLLFDLP